MIDSVKTAKKLIEQRAKTKTGLKVFAKVIEKQYEKGKKASKEFLDKLPIIFDDFLPLWNYKTVPKFWNGKVIIFLSLRVILIQEKNKKRRQGLRFL